MTVGAVINSHIPFVSLKNLIMYNSNVGSTVSDFIKIKGSVVKGFKDILGACVFSVFTFSCCMYVCVYVLVSKYPGVCHSFIRAAQHCACHVALHFSVSE